MSYVDGLPADDLICQLGAIPEKDTLNYYLQIVDALEYA